MSSSVKEKKPLRTRRESSKTLSMRSTPILKQSYKNSRNSMTRRNKDLISASRSKKRTRRSDSLRLS